MIERITVLGGSSVYVPEFVVSLIAHNINVREIALVGSTSSKKLQIVAGFCQRLLDNSGFPVKVIPTSDLSEGVSGAKYVVNNIRVGGMKARIRDEKLPLLEGLLGDESLGAGGFACALRTLPVVLEQAAIIERVNPDATIINLTNPIGTVLDALIKTTSLRAVGACDLPALYIGKLAALLEAGRQDLTVDYIGLNHLGWIQDIKVRGQSQMARVLELLEPRQEEGFDYDLIELFHMIPVRTVSLYFHQDVLLRRQQKAKRFRGEQLHAEEKQILELYADTSLTELPALTRRRNVTWYEETIVPLIAALETEEPEEMVLTVRNNGAMRDLADDASVEVPVRVSAGGLAPRKMGNSPRFLRGMLLEVKESERLTLEAVLHHSYDCALQALTINPLVPSVDAARRFLDKIIKDEEFELH